MLHVFFLFLNMYLTKTDVTTASHMTLITPFIVLCAPQFIPMPVLYGVFLYMGVASLNGVQVSLTTSLSANQCWASYWKIYITFYLLNNYISLL